MQAAIPARREVETARGIALELTRFDPDDLGPGNLSLRLGVSAWLVRGGTDLHAALDGLLAMRAAILRLLPAETVRGEPVPLLVEDPASAVLSVAQYLHGLIGRAARRAGLTRVQLVEAAAADLARTAA